MYIGYVMKKRFFTWLSNTEMYNDYTFGQHNRMWSQWDTALVRYAERRRDVSHLNKTKQIHESV